MHTDKIVLFVHYCGMLIGKYVCLCDISHMFVFGFRDGRLQEGDQILAIDGQPLDISHHQAIKILQSASGFVEIVVARGSIPAFEQSESETTEPANTGTSDQPADMVVSFHGLSVSWPVNKKIQDHTLKERMEFFKTFFGILKFMFV